MVTFDMKKDRRDLYAPSVKDFVEVVVPPMTFLTVDGHGDPNTSPAYREAVEALYAASYTAKFASKLSESGRDFVVGPLEGFWTADDPAVFVTREKDAWSWTMAIRQPDWLTPEVLEEAIATAARKKDLPGLARVQVQTISEGPSLQIMHIGSYDDETPTLARLHDEVMPELGFTFNGPHHEIYLVDPRRTAPEKLKTILRQPVRPR